MRMILFTTIVMYAVVVSQSFMYMLTLRNTQLALSANSYTEFRQLTDANMNGIFKYVMYATLFITLLWTLVNVKTSTSLAFITAAVAFAGLLVDGILTLKGNVALNKIINTWSPTHYPENWKEVRSAWFHVFQFRQVANIIGFISLMIGTVWGR